MVRHESKFQLTSFRYAHRCTSRFPGALLRPRMPKTSLAGPLLASDFPNPPSSILCIPSMQSNRKLYIVHTRQRTLVDRATKHLECACNQHIKLALTIIHICMYEYGYSISAACPLSQTRPICLHTFSHQRRCHAIM